MRLFDSCSGRKESYAGSTAKMYVCGITPYDVTHLGHAFTYVFFDVLARYLEYRGKKVTYVQNITDVDDDMIRKARETGKDWKKLGEENWRRFCEDNRRLNNRKQDCNPKASEHIKEIDALNRTLKQKGYAYERNGSLYFEVSKHPKFGRLSRTPKSKMLSIANQRGNFPEDPNKKNPLDFVLWQKKKEGEPYWKSSISEGRPGWHIECSAMSLKYLGPTLDIHGGGKDLAFPHHEAEIAQSEPCTGKHFARFWMHTGMVRCRGKKMSKSLGNMVFISELLKKHNANTIRIMLLSNHYRKEWEYSEKLMEKAAETEKNLKKGGNRKINPGKLSREFFAAMDDDLNTPKAIRTLAKIAQGSKNKKAKDMLMEYGDILGLKL